MLLGKVLEDNEERKLIEMGHPLTQELGNEFSKWDRYLPNYCGVESPYLLPS